MIKATWWDIKNKISLSDINIYNCKKVYGVPRGGIPVAILVSQIHGLELVETIDSETLIVDDIIDSGKTRKRFKDYPFFAVYEASSMNDWVEFPWERLIGEKPAEDSITRILEYIGEDINREGLRETPKRVIETYNFLFSGYRQTPEQTIKTFDSEAYNEIILLKDIELYSICEHHLLPFVGKAHVAYIPNKKIIGISKLARIIEMYSRRIQIQERIGKQVTSCLMKYLEPFGAACIIEAQHLCMQMRGVQKQNSVMITSSLEGVFMEKPESKQELMGLLK